ncbi:hypothetical protein [Sporosarcina sp. P7]|uniref:hypothetical protein n=1 Tax=Sporosarcina sp. P7 TaxID=2048244 RepID=UPI00117DDE39|nr:hypothetical protein [Sporosarcina sp. P7]
MLYAKRYSLNRNSHSLIVSRYPLNEALHPLNGRDPTLYILTFYRRAIYFWHLRCAPLNVARYLLYVIRQALYA